MGAESPKQDGLDGADAHNAGDRGRHQAQQSLFRHRHDGPPDAADPTVAVGMTAGAGH
jgi:hypothetical protein